MMQVVSYVRICLAFSMSVLVACASDPTKQAAAGAMQDDPSKGIVCTYSIPTGSSLREKKCTTPEQRELQRQEAEHSVTIRAAGSGGR